MKILIIGGGIAGTALAHHCLSAGIDVRLVEKGENRSSVVAAGIVNPLVFRRITLSWRAAELIPFAKEFYRSVGGILGTDTLHPVVIRRFFASAQEAGYWQQKQHLPEFAAFMYEQTPEDAQFDSPLNTFGTARVKGAFWIDAARFCPKNWEWLEAKGVMERAAVDYADIDPAAGTYRGEAFDHIVFCEGKDGRYNPWFGDLPLQQTKGEVLTIHAPGLSQEESLNRRCFLLPVGGGQFRVGSTYVWDTDNTDITEEGRNTIAGNIASVTNEPYTIVSQVAGVRPTVTDRRPLFGAHPEFPKLVFANGLGTKGYMVAPLMMKELLEHLTDGRVIHPEARIGRFGR